MITVTEHSAIRAPQSFVSYDDQGANAHLWRLFRATWESDANALLEADEWYHQYHSVARKLAEHMCNQWGVDLYHTIVLISPWTERSRVLAKRISECVVPDGILDRLPSPNSLQIVAQQVVYIDNGMRLTGIARAATLGDGIFASSKCHSYNAGFGLLSRSALSAEDVLRSIRDMPVLKWGGRVKDASGALLNQACLVNCGLIVSRTDYPQEDIGIDCYLPPSAVDGDLA